MFVTITLRAMKAMPRVALFVPYDGES